MIAQDFEAITIVKRRDCYVIQNYKYASSHPRDEQGKPYATTNCALIDVVMTIVSRLAGRVVTILVIDAAVGTLIRLEAVRRIVVEELAVAIDGIRECSLKVAGVKDCKLLTDKKILELEPVIKREALAYSVLQLKPKFYNQRYAEVLAKGGKLNQLLASGHINALTAVLKQLEEKDISCDYALVDQFTNSGIVIKPLQLRFPNVDFSQRPKAESNIAVAAASISARAQFLHTTEELALSEGEA